MIENTSIRLISPELGQKKQQEQKSMVYINLMACLEKNKAEFLFVVFSNGSEHQYDISLNFTKNIQTENYDLDKIEYENYLNLNGKLQNGGSFIAKENTHRENDRSDFLS